MVALVGVAELQLAAVATALGQTLPPTWQVLAALLLGRHAFPMNVNVFGSMCPLRDGEMRIHSFLAPRDVLAGQGRQAMAASPSGAFPR